MLKRDEDQNIWSEEELRLVEEITTQLSLALENNRLYEETQKRAERERLISQVTSNIRQTLDIDTVLQSTVWQMQGILGLESAEVRLNDTFSRPTAGYKQADGGEE